MPIHVWWDSPQQTVLVHQFTDPWNWDEFHRMLQESLRMQEESPQPQPLNIIIDFSQTLEIPLGAVTQFAAALRQVPPEDRYRAVVLCRPSLLLRTIGRVVTNMVSISPHLVHEADNLEAARALLARLDAEAGR